MAISSKKLLVPRALRHYYIVHVFMYFLVTSSNARVASSDALITSSNCKVALLP